MATNTILKVYCESHIAEWAPKTEALFAFADPIISAKEARLRQVNREELTQPSDAQNSDVTGRVVIGNKVYPALEMGD